MFSPPPRDKKGIVAGPMARCASILMLAAASSRAARAAAPGAPSAGTLAPAAEQPIRERLAQAVRTQLKAEEKAVVRKMQAERAHAAPPSRQRKAERTVAKEIEMLATQRGTISVGEPGEATEPRPSVVRGSAPDLSLIHI